MKKGGFLMRQLKKMFYFLMIGICIICFHINNVSANDEICFHLKLPPGWTGTNGTILKLGFTDYGNNHYALTGTATSTIIYPGNPKIIGLVHGNAEIVNGKLEASFTGSEMSSDNTSASNTFYHLRLDMTTLSGNYTMTYLGSTNIRAGAVSVVSCSDY
jgi:hypothetical protein